MSTPARAARRSPVKVNYVASSDEDEDGVRVPVAGLSRKRKARIVDSESDEYENTKALLASGKEDESQAESDAGDSEASSAQDKDSESAVSEASASKNEDSDEEIVEKKPVVKKKAPAPRKSTSGVVPKPKSTELDESLPPLVKISDIFQDLVRNALPGLVEVSKKLAGRKIRVATMCSGTESPLLALEQISRALKTLSGERLEIEHIFSCEIVPIKQAYIERNFSPPLLFRNVEELGGDQAHTAYAGLADVPGNVDVLIAGTSCVDYSGLNNKKKTIDAGGESGKTFEGMMRYVVKHQPPVVILENVLSAPWDKVAEKFAENGYWAEHVTLDTKNYYIPHTRVRGYLIAVPKASGKTLPSKWVTQVQQLRRPASSPLEAFLLPTDDPRIHRAREDLSKVATNADGAKRAPVEWSKCEGRHARARVDEYLGKKRPLTAWQDRGGGAQLPDGGWTDWAAGLTERVTDLMDISLLRLARDGVDVSYKSAIWNLSQNVDRNTDSKKLSICPCLTPTMVPYLANRGGPVIGLEALALQGLPIEELRLTRENDAQIADLAGNAMSSTVVGASLISALIVAVSTFPDRDAEDVEMEVAALTQTAAEHIRGEDRLSTSPLDLVTCKPLSPSLFGLASASVRKCVCEGRSGTASSKILVCESCLHSSCTACSGRPDHHYKPNDEARSNPDEFALELKQTLPMRFSLDGFDLAKLQATIETLSLPVDQKLNKEYLETVAAAVNSNDNEFHFKTLTRRDTWVATYTASRVVLELHFVAGNPEWRLFVLPDRLTPGNSPLRKLLGLAVARLKLASNAPTLLSGVWELRVPLITQQVELTLESNGVLVPSWRANLGLTKFLDEKRAKQFKISCSDSSLLEQSIDGTYILEEQCGTAANSLFRRFDADLPGPLFLFLDPSRSGDAKDDSFVFSNDCGRLDYGISRPVVATLNCKWRPSVTTAAETVQLSVTSTFVPLTATDVNSSEASVAGSSTFSVPSENFTLNFDADACSFAEAILSAHVVTSDSVRHGISTSKEWEQVDLLHQGSDIFSKLAWILARFPEMKALENWQDIINPRTDNRICQTCCPTPPEIEWSRTAGKGYLPDENGIEAAAFEQALKSRPTPIDVQVRQVDDCSEFRIGLNIATLAHKALDALPKSVVHTYSVSNPTSSWRLVAANGFSLAFGKNQLVTSKFRLTSNITNGEAPAPPGFKVDLRKEQRRSLTWMIEQETSPSPWVEEEVCEAALAQLGWHAEARASRVVQVRGGVLADDVGYGKTAIIVGLICSQKKSIVLPLTPDRVAVKATLVVVPPHLVKQWPSEISKFAKGLNVVKIVSIVDLKKLSIEDIQEADVIVTTSSIFKSEVLWAQTGDFAAGSRAIPCKANARYFNACLDEAVESIPGQIALLRGPEGPKAAFKKIKQVRLERIAAAAADLKKVNPSKRLVGAAYAKDQAKKKAKDDDEVSDDEPPAKKKAKVAAKKEVVVEVDPWGLSSAVVRKDWTQMMSPPLMMFSFDRIVVDEYTYLEPTELSGVLALRASSRWILSGTPPLKNFAEIKTIAALLHVNLGIDDDEDDFTHKGTAKANTLQTRAEQFHSFREVHTTAWHERRNNVAQQFLDQYVRQNKAEIGDIKFAEQLEVVELPAPEMAIYRELEHYMLGLDENLTKVVKVSKTKKGDRNVRIAEALGFSKSPDEALLKRCSHFSTDMDDETAALEGGAPDVCTSILNKRETQLEECQEEYKKKVVVAVHAHRIAEKSGLYGTGKNEEDRPVLRHLQFISKSVDDADAFAFLKQATDGMLNSDETKIVKIDAKPDRAELKLWKDLTEKTADDRDVKRYAIREMATYLRKLQKELVARHRSKRYFEAVRHFQINRPADAVNISLLSCCGHQGPTEDILAAARKSVCIAEGCSATVSQTHVVSATSLGVEATSGQFGIKLEVLVDLVKSVPEEDRILVFVQFEELLDKVEEALVANGVDVAILKGSANVVSKTLDTFQDPKSDGQRVLLLLVTSSSASGANLTIANWAFFVSPLYTDTQAQYTAFELQAIGRIRRFGQLKAVTVVRLLTKDTKDIEIYEQRTQSIVAEIVAQQSLDGTNMERQPSSVHEARRKNTGSKTSKSKPKVDLKGKGKANKQEIILDSDSDEDSAEETDEESAEETDEEEVRAKPMKKKAAGKSKLVVDSEDSDDDSEEEPKKKKRVEKGKGKAVPEKAVAKKKASKEKVEKVVKEKVVKEKVVKEKVVKEKVVKERKPRASNRTPVEEAEFKQTQILKSQKAAKANLKQTTLFEGFNKKFRTASPKKSTSKEVEKENDEDVEMIDDAPSEQLVTTGGNVTEEDGTTVGEDMNIGEVDMDSLDDDEKALWA